MAGGYSVGIASETRAFKQGVDTGIIRPLEDAQDALDALGKSRGPEQLERSLEDAQDATERLKRETKETADAIDKEYRDSYRKMKQNSRDSFDGAGENVKNFKSEAVQNLSEVASSFSGDIDDMASGVQGLTGGLASALTPGIGIPVAILGAAAAAFFASWKENAEKTEERIGEMYDDMLDSGKTFVSDTFVDQKIGEIVGKTDEWNKVKERSTQLGISESLILRAMAGDLDAGNLVIDAAKSKREALQGVVERQIDAGGRASESTLKERDSFTALIDEMGKLATEQDTAAGKATAARGAMDLSTEANKRNAESVDGVTQAIDRLPNGRRVDVSVYADMTDVERRIDALNGRAITLRVRGEGMSGSYLP